jgi:hypothetical protein
MLGAKEIGKRFGVVAQFSWQHELQVAFSSFVVGRDENGINIFRPYSRPNSFRGVPICPYSSPNIQHPISYPYSNT